MRDNASKFIARAALIALAGYVLSGPASVAFVMAFFPQPAWTSAPVFVAHYHFLQNLSYYFGFLLVGGMLMLFVGHYRIAGAAHKRQTLLALVLSAPFAALIFFNYIAQTTFVHNLVRNYRPGFDAAIAIFSMANPLSLCWGIEMWGYAILGVATWLLAPYYRDRSVAIRYLLVLNGWMSVVGGVFTAADAGWVLTTAGLTAYSLWNLVMMALMVLIYRDAVKRGH